MTKPLMLTELELSVRPLNQHELQPTAPGQENMACWFASAMMVLNFRTPLATLALNNVHTMVRRWKNEGVYPHEMWRLAQEAGLEHSSARAVLNGREPADWQQALTILGPLMITVGAHAVVARGIIRQGLDWHVVFNDPMPGVRRTMVLPRFNSLMNGSLPVLYRRTRDTPPIAQIRPVPTPLSRS